jgi:hypothetical protein
MSEYLLYGFKDHPSLGPILTRHLFTSRAPASKLKALEARMSSVETAAKLANITADKAFTAAAKKKA